MANDPEQAHRLADRIDAGMVYVNIVGADSAELRLAVRSDPGSVASSAATARTSSSTRS
jgi:acyl-CoA reductase-like NAD-dependent aldehyde dehydrogenase